MLNGKVWTASLAITGAIGYLLCLIGRAVAPETGYHESVLEVVLPGFQWLTPLGFTLGLIDSMIYGAVVGFIFATVHNALYRGWAKA